jgi:hypothetical protein
MKINRMEANELRIGNWVKQGSYSYQPCKGIEIARFESFQKGLKEAEYYSEWEPIPLTEEWLLKFGFEKKGQRYIKYFFGDYIGVDVEDFSVGTYAFGRIAHAPQPTFMNVHQLQNLYFALTGKELTINEL